MFGKIIGTGSYAPDNVVCNNDLKEFFETDDQWIRERTGIKRRHIMTDESTSYMACRAAEKAIENAGISCEKIDLIIVSTVSTRQSFSQIIRTIQRHRQTGQYPWKVQKKSS